MRLGADTLAQLPASVGRPEYDRGQAVGIVHFGLGAFHRAHQADYVDHCLADGETGWMIAGISLRSDTVRRQMAPQDGLYTLTEKGVSARVVGAVKQSLVAGRDDALIVDRIASPSCRVVSFTVTEKGYCRAPDGSLDMELAREGFYPLLGEALRCRRELGLPGLTLLSCDNLSGNGRLLAKLVAQWFDRENWDVRSWFENECAAPDTMVDRIVPATSEADLDRLERRLGIRDEAAVFTEPFSQWIIEDRFATTMPGWHRHGVEVVPDVEPYENAKLRMLNGAHSASAYLGLVRGHEFVHQAIADAPLRALVDRLMRNEAAPSITRAAGQDLDAYADRLLERFADPALEHRLAQIAMDGSQKVAQRWLETLAWHAERAVTCPALLTALAGWIRHLSDGGGPVSDPRAKELSNIVERAGTGEVVEALFGSRGAIASPWIPRPADTELITKNLRKLPELPTTN